MKTDHPRLVKQCHLLRGSKLLHLQIHFDGEDYSNDLHLMQLNAWRLGA